MKDDTQGNPSTVQDNVVGSNSDDFFSALDDSVNGMVAEGDSPEAKTSVTPTRDAGNVEAKADISQNSELENMRKRYSDSSREAQNLKAQLNELKPFVPVLDAMKKDNGLVNHVRNYFEKGGEVSDDIKKQLNLDENFEFDADDMINNSKGESRKVFNSMVDNIVQQRTGQMLSNMERQNAEEEYKNSLNKQAAEFMRNNNLSEEQFNDFVAKAQSKFQNEGMNFDDMWLIINKGQAAQNVANSTKQDMLNQMKNVRDIPTSQGASNNAGEVSKNPSDEIFDTLLNSDGNIEEVLGSD